MAKTSKFQLPPKPSTAQPEAKPKAVNEKKIQEIISKGGGSVKRDEPKAADKLKKLTVRLLETQHEEINRLRDLRPKEPRRRIAISLEDWVIEAIEEKLQRERKKYS